MCTNSRWIYNRYSRQSVLVRCGKCDSCKQEKALARTNRIRNHHPEGFIFLFITLTYTNDYVTYISRSELSSSSNEINVYRNCTGRYIYSSAHGLRFKKENEISIIDSYFVSFDYRSDFEVRSLSHLKGLDSDKIGICYYPDLQNFFKRLRINYERQYGKQPIFDYFAVAEYGGHSYRPHFHILLSIPTSDEAPFRSLIVSCWPYADSKRTAKFIEIARDAASYVASYVNGSLSLSSCLSCDVFRQKHSQSKNLGVLLDCFALPQILQKIDERDLHYYCKKKFDGESCVNPLLVPQYVINRYFPLFKGISWLTSSTLYDVLVSPSKLWNVFKDWRERFEVEFYNFRYRNKDGTNVYTKINLSTYFERSSNIVNPEYTFSRNEVYQIVVRLMRAQLYFMSETGLNAFDFADYYIRCWDCYHSTLIKDSLTGVKCLDDFSEFYFNSNDLIHDLVCSPTLQGLVIHPDYNQFLDNVVKSANLAHTYFLKDKTKKVVNYSMAAIGYDV